LHADIFTSLIFRLDSLLKNYSTFLEERHNLALWVLAQTCYSENIQKIDLIESRRFIHVFCKFTTYSWIIQSMLVIYFSQKTRNLSIQTWI